MNEHPHRHNAQRRERRWAIIAEDGRHVWLGRATDPSEAELRLAEKRLLDVRLGGYLAIVEGDYWSRRSVLGFINVKAIAGPSIQFEDAMSIFERRRQRILVGAD